MLLQTDRHLALYKMMNDKSTFNAGKGESSKPKKGNGRG